jgi:hypothetical protein
MQVRARKGMISRRKKALCTLLEETKGSRMPETGTRERKTGTEKRRKGALKHTGCDHNWRKEKKLYSRQRQVLNKCSEGGPQKKSRELGFLAASDNRQRRACSGRAHEHTREREGRPRLVVPGNARIHQHYQLLVHSSWTENRVRIPVMGGYSHYQLSMRFTWMKSDCKESKTSMTPAPPLKYVSLVRGGKWPYSIN